jgi:hypothetical protein
MRPGNSSSRTCAFVLLAALQGVKRIRKGRKMKTKGVWRVTESISTSPLHRGMLIPSHFLQCSEYHLVALDLVRVSVMKHWAVNEIIFFAY